MNVRYRVELSQVERTVPFNAVVPIAAETDLHDLARERRFIPAEPFGHVAVEFELKTYLQAG